MEKRKVYKISIIDKEISRTEFDRNTFYTSDSELTLVFKLIERDYSYDHGEILLYNEDDKSFVTRKIKKQENDFVYELDSDIIPHYGTWKAQLQLVNDGDFYTSKPFEFSIVNDLSNLAPQPTLTDINNWSTLKKNAAELIDEMQTVIDDIKKAESKHENAEMIRQSQENSRVQSESERQSQERLRSQGESQRQTQENKRVESENERRLKEIERENSESNRQSIFENNEVRRKETFNTNEKTRQENETARQQAESQRQSSEIIRVENENQRKIDHANRSAELVGKADKVIIKNLVENGDFSNGLTGLRTGGGNSTIDTSNSVFGNQSLKVTVSVPFWTHRSFYTNVTVGDLYYISGYIYTKTGIAAGNGLKVEENIGELSNYGGKRIVSFKDAIEKWVFGSILHTPLSEHLLVGVKEYIKPEENYNIDGIQLINLTQTFGAGNEPTKEEMDELIKITGYIDNEYALNNKEMLIWTLSLIRRNKNAIISLGGA